jgi:hypothetical protein
MRRSIHVTAPLLAAAALAMTIGCRKPDMQRCVDEHNNVVADSFCKDLPNQQHTGNTLYPMYRYYYGGWGGFGTGTHADGGSFSPATGHSYSTGTVRGGFGSSFSGGHGGGGE